MLKEQLDAGDALVIVDVRKTWEYSLAQIPGSINFPHHHHGARSDEGAQILIESGFPRVANLIGGIDAWSSLAGC
jgi:rhodanese-related sulfurtransferase